VQRAVELLADASPGLDPELARLYVLLVLVKGQHATLEDVHDAWAVWRNHTRPAHRSLVPFDSSPPRSKSWTAPSPKPSTTPPERWPTSPHRPSSATSAAATDDPTSTPTSAAMDPVSAGPRPAHQHRKGCESMTSNDGYQPVPLGDPGSPEHDLIEATRVFGNGRCAQTIVRRSICAHLAVIPEITRGQFTGGFTALHIPTGLALNCLDAWSGQLTPELADDAILGVSELDWANPDPAFYHGRSGVGHRAAWKAAVELTAKDHYGRRGEWW
jgi:hypothetical protein